MTFFRKHQNALLLGLVLIVAFALRLYGIRWGLPGAFNPNFSFHPDEVVSLLFGEQLYAGQIVSKQFMYGGTLFFSLLHALAITGQLLTPALDVFNAVAGIILTGRYFMLFVSMMTLVLVYRVGCYWLGKSGGLLAVLALAVMPGHIVWAQQVRPDEVGAFLVAVFLWLATKIDASSGREQRNYLALSAALSGLTLAYRFPLLLFGLMPLVALIFQQEGRPTLSSGWQKIFPTAFLLHAVLIPIAYLVCSPHSLTEFETLWAGLTVQLNYQTDVFVDSIDRGPRAVQYWWSMLHQATGYPLYFTSLTGVLLAMRQHPRVLPVLLTGLAPYLVILPLTSWVVVRYTLPLLPLLALATAYLLQQAWSRVNKPLVTAAFAGCVALTLMADVAFLRLEASRNVRFEIRDWMEANIPQQSCLMVFKDYTEDVFFNPNLDYPGCHYFLEIPRAVLGPDGKQRDFGDYFGEVFTQGQIEYVVLHEFLYGNMQRLDDRHPDPAFVGLWNILQSPRFEQIYSLKRVPQLFGLDFSSWFASHDYGYINPGYQVFKATALPACDPTPGSCSETPAQ